MSLFCLFGSCLPALQEEVALGEDLSPKVAKALPRLPSSDDAYESFEQKMPSSFSAFSSESTATLTSQASTVKAHAETGKDDYFDSKKTETIPEEEVSAAPTPSASALSAAPPPSVPPKDDVVERLAKLRHSLQRQEQNLYIQLSNTSPSVLNDVRRSFLASAKGTTKRLAAWKKKHLGSKQALAGKLEAVEPAWWNPGSHAVPGTNIIVREQDWGSIIAFTLGYVAIEVPSANRLPISLQVE